MRFTLKNELLIKSYQNKCKQQQQQQQQQQKRIKKKTNHTSS
jgi:hypothetical protein